MMALANGSGLLPRRRDLPSQEMGAELLVRDPEAGQVHFLNAAATLVWQCCDGATPLENCVQRLNQAFTVPPGVDLAVDVREIVRSFARKGILEDHGDS